MFSHGFWITPVGGIEGKESFQEALRLEIFKEIKIILEQNLTMEEA